MKALKNKYGKRPWLDTPNSQWYRDRVGMVAFLRNLTISQIAAAGHGRVSTIRSATIPKDQKAALIAEAEANTMKAISAMLNSEQFRMPDKNKGSRIE